MTDDALDVGRAREGRRGESAVDSAARDKQSCEACRVDWRGVAARQYDAPLRARAAAEGAVAIAEEPHHRLHARRDVRGVGCARASERRRKGARRHGARRDGKERQT